MKNIKLFVLASTFILTANCIFAQSTNNTEGVSISSTVVPPNPSAMLDVSSNSKGILIPRVALLSVTDVTTIPNPANSLLVYNTNNASPDLTQGFYYWQLLTASSGKWLKINNENSELWKKNNTTNNVYIGTQANSSNEGSILIGTDIAPSGSKAKVIINGPLHVCSTNIYDVTHTNDQGIHIGEFMDDPNNGHENEINVHGTYLDVQYNTGKDVQIGAGGKGSNVKIFEGTEKEGKLIVEGDISSHYQSVTSDSTLKENIVKINNVLPKVELLNLYKYNFKKDEDTEKHLGVIAQELEIQFPELVKNVNYTKSKGINKNDAIENISIKTVDYSGLSAVLLQAIKEQQAQIESLKARINTLEQK